MAIDAVIDEYTILKRYHDRIAYIDTSGGYTASTGHIHGAAGYVTEMATLWPDFEWRYWELLQAGSYRDAEIWRSRVWPFYQFVLDQTAKANAFSWVSVLKAALEYVGLEGGPVRPPFRALNQEEKTVVFDILRSIGLPEKSA